MPVLSRKSGFWKSRKWSVLLLAGWLIAVGAISLLDLGNDVLSAVVNLTAIAAGVLLLLER